MQSSAGVGGRLCPPALTIVYINAPEVPTRHTHKWDGLNTRHLLESTHTQTHTHTNKHTSRPDDHADSRRGGALLTRGGRLAPTPSKEAASLSRSPTPKLCAPPVRHRKALCLQREPHRRRPAQLSSFSYCRFVSLFRTLSCIRRKSHTTGSLQPPYRSRRAASATKSVSERDSAWAYSGFLYATQPAGRCGAKSCHYPRRQQCPLSALDAALREDKDVRPRAGRGVAGADEGTTPPDVLHVGSRRGSLQLDVADKEDAEITNFHDGT